MVVSLVMWLYICFYILVVIIGLSGMFGSFSVRLCLCVWLVLMIV